MQIGNSGGQTQPRASSTRKRFTRRSSSDWKEITASLPPAASSSQASGSAASSWASSSLTAILIAWKTRFAGWPPANWAGTGIALLITSTSSWVEVARRGRGPDDRACDLFRVALLTVVAEQPREPALFPAVDDLGCRQLLRRDPCACRAAPRRSRRSRAPTCRPASRTCQGPCRPGSPPCPRHGASPAPQRSPRG